MIFRGRQRVTPPVSAERALDPSSWRSMLGRRLPFLRHWKIATCFAACSLFTIAALQQFAAQRELDGHIRAMAASGGGVLLVMSEADCAEAAPVSEAVASILAPAGMRITGLVLPYGLGRMDELLAAGNDHFPHVAVSSRVGPLLGRIGTPVAMAVGPSGRIGAAERYGLEGLSGAEGLARRLIASVKADR